VTSAHEFVSDKTGGRLDPVTGTATGLTAMAVDALKSPSTADTVKGAASDVADAASSAASDAADAATSAVDDVADAVDDATE